MISVGLWSLGVALCAVGVGLLIGNITGSPMGARLSDFWGAIPLLLGLELLVAQYRAHLKAKAGEPAKIRLHAGSVAGLMTLVVVAMVANLAAGPNNDWTFGGFPGWAHLGESYPYEVSASVDISAGELAGIDTVAMTLQTGSLVVQGADTDKVVVEGTITARARVQSLADAAVRDAKIVFAPEATEGNVLRFALQAPGYDPETGNPNVQLHADLTITVPKDMNLDLDGTTVDMEASNVAGDVAVGITTGDTEIYLVGGDVTIHATTSEVVAEDIEGSVVVRTTTGSVTLLRVAGDVDASATTGEIHAMEPGGAVRVSTTTGSCTVFSSKPVAGDWSAGTTTGEVSMTFAMPSDVAVTAGTTMGIITTNLALPISSSIGRKSMEGTIGKGTYRLDLEATTGTVSVNGNP